MRQNWSLEAHLVRELSLGQRKASLQVLPQNGAVGVSLDRSQDLGVDGSLVSLPLLRGLVCLLLGLEDVTQSQVEFYPNLGISKTFGSNSLQTKSYKKTHFYPGDTIKELQKCNRLLHNYSVRAFLAFFGWKYNHL